ncbi:MAG: hypothetical protein HQK83_16745 [Fibrobacteria bacterium]|nr:hypothetical protein [Fibrobacteria bacterium]
MKSLNKQVCMYLLFIVFVTGCSIMGEDPLPFDPARNNRRAYINDLAANDSLNQAIVEGMNFYAQPGCTYQFQVSGYLHNDCKLHSYRMFSAWDERLVAPVEGSWLKEGEQVSYSLSPDFKETGLLWVIMRNKNGDHCNEGISDFSLFGEGGYAANQFGINYHFLGSFTGFSQDDISPFTDSLHNRIALMYNEGAGVNVQKSGPHFSGYNEPYTMKFPYDFENPPNLNGGTSGFINVVFVSRITSESSGGDILGFAPREGLGMNEEPINWVIILFDSDYTRLWSTVAHEVGHFLGLRHTVATDLDLQNENDFSNLDDGFTDTEYCDLDGGTGISAEPGTYWCVRLAGNSLSAIRCSITARRNLMFPYEQPTLNQNILSEQQSSMIQTNLTVIQH